MLVFFIFAEFFNFPLFVRALQHLKETAFAQEEFDSIATWCTGLRAWYEQFLIFSQFFKNKVLLFRGVYVLKK